MSGEQAYALVYHMQQSLQVDKVPAFICCSVISNQLSQSSRRSHVLPQLLLSRRLNVMSMKVVVDVAAATIALLLHQAYLLQRPLCCVDMGFSMIR